MGSTRIRAGLIKIATGEGRISPKEEQVARAAARARRATGAPIIAHTTGGMGPELLDIMTSEGLEPRDLIVSHVGFEPDPRPYAESLFRRGANVSFDRIGFKVFFADEHWLDLIGWAIGQGWLNQILLSHDAGVLAHGLEVASGENIHDDFTYISRVFVPKLLAIGVTDAQIETILATNAQRVLTFAA